MAVATGAGKVETYQGDYKRMGKVGEGVVLAWLKTKANVREVIDLRGLVEWQEQDVDFEIVYQDGRRRTAEVKTDTYLGKTGYVLFELLRINHVTRHGKDGEVGWSLRTPANWLFFYAPAVHEILYAPSAWLRTFFQQWSQEKRQAMELRIIATDRNKTTLVALVPWTDCGHLFTRVSVFGGKAISNGRKEIWK